MVDERTERVSHCDFDSIGLQTACKENEGKAVRDERDKRIMQEIAALDRCSITNTIDTILVHYTTRT